MYIRIQVHIAYMHTLYIYFIYITYVHTLYLGLELNIIHKYIFLWLLPDSPPVDPFPPLGPSPVMCCCMVDPEQGSQLSMTSEGVSPK